MVDMAGRLFPTTSSGLWSPTPQIRSPHQGRPLGPAYWVLPEQPETPAVCLAVHSCPQSGTCFNEPKRLERADVINQTRFRNYPEIVKTDGALLGHAVIRAEPHLGGKTPDRAGNRSCEHTVEHWDSRRSGHDEERTPSKVLYLTPPDLPTLVGDHHGSSTMASRRDATAARSSASVCGWRV